MSKSIVKKEETSLELQNFAQEFGTGLNVRRELLRVPRLKLVNALSDANQSGLAKPGDFACDVLSKNYGKEVTIVPILVTESASLLFSKKAPPANMDEEDITKYNEGSILCSTSDMVYNSKGFACKSCPWGEYYADWGSNDEKRVPQCKTSIDVVCVIDGEIEPMFINFRKTNYKAGKVLLNHAFQDPNKIVFGTKYKLKSEPGQSGGYKYFAISQAIEKAKMEMSEIQKLIPLARRLLEAEKKGQLQREQEGEVPVSKEDIDSIPV